jgi:predicted transposase/invertase (TIGR01784 family)
LKRGEYSLEILEMIEERVADAKKARSFRNFAHNILEIDKTDINPKVKEAWKMRFRPVSEVVRELDIRDARQEGWQEGWQEGIFEAARNFLKMGIPAEQVAQGVGLTLEELGKLR